MFALAYLDQNVTLVLDDDHPLAALRSSTVIMAPEQPVRPPFHVPPEDLTAWDGQDKDNYQYWRGQSDMSKEDYREFLIRTNKEYNMEEAFDKLEAAVNALEVIVGFQKNFPKYNLYDDLDWIYKVKDDLIFKEFVKCGVNFIENNFNTVDLSQVDSTGIDTHADPIVINSESATKDTTPIKDEKVDVIEEKNQTKEKNICEAKVEEIESLATPDAKEEFVEDQNNDHLRRKKKKNKKKSGMRRPLKYQESLVKVRGLASSRLMGGLSREFDEIGAVAEETSTDQEKGVVGNKEIYGARFQGGNVRMGGQTEMFGNGISSRYANLPLLSSSPVSSVNCSPFIPQPGFHTPPPPLQHVLNTPHSPTPTILHTSYSPLLLL